MIRRWIFRCQYRLNSTLVGSSGKAASGGSSSYTFTPQTTPYSDKYYQPIISEGIRGVDKLIIPRDFVAKNQEIDIANDDVDRLAQQQQLQDIVATFNAPIKVAIGYGSGVFPQAGYQQLQKKELDNVNGATTPSGKEITSGTSYPTQIDFIHIVDDNHEFHRLNLKQNRDHYSIKSTSLIKFIQGKNGIYFNPFITVKNKLIKYGIISVNSGILDLIEWTSLYFAGRLQKPVNFVKDDDIRIKFLNQYNLKNAMTVAILLLESNVFNERQLYEQITKLSYLGDFRMYIGGENPNKVQNIVDSQLAQFKKLYDPILQYFIHRNYLIITDNNEEIRTLKKNLNVNNRINLISTLPLQFRKRLYSMYQDKSIKDIVRDQHLAQNIIKIVSRTIQISSVRQAIMGIFSSGLIKSIKYAFAKQLKFWQGVFKKK
ncbi:mitochondrial matrix Mmp37-domain-containing protein [Scheffersomyces xylosifermentans]|uniref:mitochondrial matrix Mmp37-domain-containing protein n=1 Tax=Scheffersomyces xylosifermentans TaxID=1304137 RepID=UPI00315C56FC